MMSANWGSEISIFVSSEMEPLTVVVCIITTLTLMAYQFIKWRYTYWKRRGIYYKEPVFPYGNFKTLVKGQRFIGDVLEDMYKEFKSKGLKGGGCYSLLQPMYLLVDTEAIKHVVQTDFGSFRNHGRIIDKEVDPLNGHLLYLKDDEWRNLRIKLTPTFSSGNV